MVLKKQPTYRDFNRHQSEDVLAVATIWNAACGSDLSISERFVRYNTTPSNGVIQIGRLAYLDGEPVGFVLASLLQNEPKVMSATTGWIDAIAVVPDAQQQQIGQTLLAWAEEWLISQGCERAVVGSSIRPFAPGVPVTLESLPFFHAHGYTNNTLVWDMAANLSEYTPPANLREIPGAVRPAQRSDADDLMTFLEREFPGRWRYEFSEFLRQPQARISDYMLLWTERGIDGFCILHFEDSHQPIERFYPYSLPRPWGQLGSVGVSADLRGQGFGMALVDAGLRRLHDNGINGCVIDWLVIVDFYAKFGFTQLRSYQQISKTLQR